MKYIYIILLFFPLNILAQNDYHVTARTNTSESNITDVSEESKFINDNFSFTPMCEWKIGFKFMPKKFDEYNKNNKARIQKKGESKNTLNSEIANEVFYFKNIEKTRVPLSAPGTFRTEINIIFVTSDSTEYIYDYRRSFSEFCNNDNRISDFIFLNDIDKARKLLIGKVLFIKNNL